MQIEAQEPYPDVSEDRTAGPRPSTLQGRGFGYPWQRWLICLLLFLATSINYMDRSVLGILAHTLDLDLRWSENDYGNVVVAFTLAYGIGYLVAGRIIDRIGAKLGYAVFVLLWTLAAMSHALVSSVLGFGVARLCLGFAESGNFPAAIRAICEWFPVEQRALATGLFNSGSNAAALVAPFFIAAILGRFGNWRYAFAGVGALGLLWLVLWLIFPYDRLRPNPDKQDTAIGSAETGYSEAPLSWRQLLKLRSMWGLIVVKAMTDPVWWLYLFWLPKFLQERFHLSVAMLGAPLATVYCFSSLGAVAGGWLSGALIRRGLSAIAARKWVLAGAAALTLSLVLGTHLHTIRSVVILFSVLTAAHQAWAANLFTVNSDLIPRSSLSTSVGIAGAAGALGGVSFQKFTGLVLMHTHGDYTAIFFMAAFAYPVSLFIFHLLTRRPYVGSAAPAMIQ
jgi:ACS family hexuronate transporter-like MFS transporter